MTLEAYYKEYPDEKFPQEFRVKEAMKEEKPFVSDKNSQLMKDGDTITVSEVEALCSR